MENNSKIENISLESIRQNITTVYSDSEIVIFDNLGKIPTDENAYLIDFTLILFCLQGKAQVSINGKQYTTNKDDMAIIMPNTLVEDAMISTDFQCSAIGLSYNELQHTLQTNNYTWNIRQFVIQNPVIPITPAYSQLGELYSKIIAQKLQSPNEMFHYEIMHSLFECLFYELLSIVRPLMEDKTYDTNVKQGDLLCKRFIDLITQAKGRERSVSHIANQLNVSPKYLSTTIKAVTNRTALQWIHEITIENIKQQLKYSDKSIKEIADDLNFPNLSFFGKFVKTHIGLSPTQFRKTRLQTQ